MRRAQLPWAAIFCVLLAISCAHASGVQILASRSELAGDLLAGAVLRRTDVASREAAGGMSAEMDQVLGTQPEQQLDQKAQQGQREQALGPLVSGGAGDVARVVSRQPGEEEPQQPQQQQGGTGQVDELAGDEVAGAFRRRRLLVAEGEEGGAAEGEGGGEEEAPLELSIFSTGHHSAAAQELAREHQQQQEPAEAAGQDGGSGDGSGASAPVTAPVTLPLRQPQQQQQEEQAQQPQQQQQQEEQPQDQQQEKEEEQQQQQQGVGSGQAPGTVETPGRAQLDARPLTVFDTADKLPQPARGGDDEGDEEPQRGDLLYQRSRRRQQRQWQQQRQEQVAHSSGGKGDGTGTQDVDRLLPDPDETEARFLQQEAAPRRARAQGTGQQGAQHGVAREPRSQRQQLEQQAQQAVQPSRDTFAQAQLAQRAAWRERAWRQEGQQQRGHAPQAPAGAGSRADGGLQAQAPVAWQARQGALGQGVARVSERAGQHVPLADVALMTLVMASAAGLGALPFFFVRSLSMRMTGLATAVACGVMFACSFDLVHTGQPYGAMLVVLGVVLGGAFIRASQQWLETLEDVQFENLKGAGARKTLLLIGVMAAHALGEGCGVGVSFVGESGWSQGVLTTLAIGIHNVPEGLAKATVLVSQGVSARQALVWSVLTCLPQPLVAIPSFLFVDAFEAILPIALGFAGGCMIWIVFAELLPDAFNAAPPKQVASAATLAAAGLEGIRMIFEQLDQQGRLALPNPFPGDPWLLLPALGVMLPAVAAAALAGGLLSNAGLPMPVSYGLASALMGCMGGLPLLRALLTLGLGPLGGRLPSPGALHVLAGAASGAALALLARHQLLRALRRRGYGRSAVSRSFVDLEAAAKKGSGSNLARLDSFGSAPCANGSSVHMYAAAYSGSISGANGGLTTVNGGLNGSSGLNGGLDGSGLNGSASFGGPAPPYSPTGRGAVTPRNVGLDFLGAWGMHAFKAASERKGGFKLAAPQYAATLAATLALALHAVPQGWHAARSMVAIAPDLSTLLLPAALGALLLGGAAGALSAASFAPSPARGAWAGGALAGGATLWALLGIARWDSAGGQAFDPADLTDRLQAVSGGALCAAALLLFGVGRSLHPRRARGGFLLGGLLAVAVYGFEGALCALSPYCMS